MREIGLKTPITVRKKKDGTLILIAGQHRLKAAKKLGWKEIDCFVVKGKSVDARLWTAAENLFRAELQPFEQAENLKEWKRLLKKQADGVQDAQPGGRQPHDKGISGTAKAFDMSREKVRGLQWIGSIPKVVQAAANKAGLGSNKEALIKIAKIKTQAAQLEKVRQLAAAKEPPRRQDGQRGRKQIKRLIRAFKKAKSFRREWGAASVPTREAFIKKVLKPKAE
jgi:ParB family chromosome partitioning protein